MDISSNMPQEICTTKQPGTSRPNEAPRTLAMPGVAEPLESDGSAQVETNFGLVMKIPSALEKHHRSPTVEIFTDEPSMSTTNVHRIESYFTAGATTRTYRLDKSLDAGTWKRRPPRSWLSILC